MVKAVKLNPDDGTVALSASCDGTVRLWDMNMRKCLYVFGDDHHQNFQQGQNFHKDSIWAMEVDQKFRHCFTGGKDGKIFKIDILGETISQVYNGDKNNPIISLKYDDKNEILWFSTTNSNVQCINLKN